jgi:tRNA (adenine57-N1/adenine58-N1)-methyltransferase catalytic subunit
MKPRQHTERLLLQDSERIHLVDTKGRQYAFTLKAGETFQYSGQTLTHDAVIGRPDGCLVRLSDGKRMLAFRPTLGEYVLKMPRGAQVIYPKDLAMMTMWGDIYPGAQVFEAGTGSGALTMALLRAVGERGSVVTYEAREDFARTALKNIERYLGSVPNLTLRRQDVYDGIDPADGPFDRIVLDLPEPWRVIPHVKGVLRSGGVYLSYVPTVPQVMRTVEALEEATVFGLIQTLETLLRTWNVQGRSVRPDHRMVAHSGFITVARKVEAGLWTAGRPPARSASDRSPGEIHEGLGSPEGEGEDSPDDMAPTEPSEDATASLLCGGRRGG